jgi:hypothetical protein
MLNGLTQADAGCIRLEIDSLEHCIGMTPGFEEDFVGNEWYGEASRS